MSIDLLTGDCQEFLNKVGLSGGTLWRGIGKNQILGYKKIAAVSARKPKHNSEVVHRVADAWFFERFGIRYRSCALFCTGSRDIAEKYGNVCRVFPFDGYVACWSRSVMDLWGEINFKGIDATDSESIVSLLESADYQESDLLSAIQSGSEIMISAPGFYLLEPN